MTYSVNKVKDEYDVVVIGSGLAGLTAANILGRNGHKVALLEQHYNFGGLATWFKRKGGHIFDISLHGFPIGMKKSARKYWGPEIADSIQQLDNVRFDNPQFKIDTVFTQEDFIKQLIEKFDVKMSTVEAFFSFVNNMTHIDDSSMDTRELFEKFFPNQPAVWRLLLEPIAYANGSTLEDPALTFGIVFSNFMKKGVFTFRGGTDQLIKRMKAILARNGVEIFNKALVEEIVVRDGVTKGVVVNGKFIAAKAVMSNAGIKNTVEKLIGREQLSERFLQECDSVRPSTSSCQVYLGIKKGEEIEDIGELLFTSEYPTLDSEALLSFRPSSRTFSFYYPKNRPEKEERYAIVSSSNARYEDWAKLDKETYAKEKARLAEETIDALENYLPGVRQKIEHIEVSTPCTFLYYTKHFSGASFGTKFEGLKVSQDLPQEVPGCFHAGSVGIIMSGWLGSMNYGVITANKIDAYLLDHFSHQENSKLKQVSENEMRV